MAEFQRVSALHKWIIGSLTSETDSEYLFGFDPEHGLMWLERPGHEYSSADPIWNEAESYIRNSSLGLGSVDVVEEESSEPEEQYVVQMSNGSERPSTVTRSAIGASFDDTQLPQPGDHRIVGDIGGVGMDYSEDDIASQAADFLMNLGEEDQDD